MTWIDPRCIHRRVLRLAVAAATLGGTMLLAPGIPPAAAVTPPPTLTGSPGYWLETSGGGVYQFGTTNFGGLTAYHLNQPVVGGAATDDGRGYWMVAADGGVFAFGDAHFRGGTGDVRLNKPIVGMAADPSSGGYWLVASDGGVFTFGGAHFYGSTGAIRLDKPIVGMAATPDGHGYWLVAADGGVFAFGDAVFRGSTGGVRLARPVVGMAAMPDGHGYWLVAADGGVFAFGDAVFRGSTGGVRLARPVVGMAAMPDGHGYWLVAADGGVFTFGDAPFLGSASGRPGPVVGLFGTAHGYPFLPGSTGNDVSVFNCPPYRQLPPVARTFNIVEVNGDGSSHTNPNPCYRTEAQWGGPNLSSYIFLYGLTSPAGASASFKYGYETAANWVSYSRSVGIDTGVWWLDVETSGSPWNLSSSARASNGQVIAGAVAAVRPPGKLPGIYSTSLQWGEITGNSVSFPGIALWVPGASSISDPTYGAVTMCKGQVPDHVTFAGGTMTLIQYGYNNGPPSAVDPDYACQ